VLYAALTIENHKMTKLTQGYGDYANTIAEIDNEFTVYAYLEDGSRLGLKFLKDGIEITGVNSPEDFMCGLIALPRSGNVLMIHTAELHTGRRAPANYKGR